MPTNYNCVDGCDTDLPEVDFHDDCDAENSASEIEDLFIANGDAIPLADWTDAAEWATRLSQTASVTGSEIRRLTVIGDKPASQPSVINTSKKRKKKIDGSHTLNFDIDDVSQLNYDFARKLQCGVQKLIWYKTRGGKQFGGNSGILAFIEINPVLGRGDEILKLVGTATWFSKQDPEMNDAVI